MASDRRQRDICRACDVLLVSQVADVHGYLQPAVLRLEACAQVEQPIGTLGLDVVVDRLDGSNPLNAAVTR
jgi:hypothetical protein